MTPEEVEVEPVRYHARGPLREEEWIAEHNVEAEFRLSLAFACNMVIAGNANGDSRMTGRRAVPPPDARRVIPI